MGARNGNRKEAIWTRGSHVLSQFGKRKENFTRVCHSCLLSCHTVDIKTMLHVSMYLQGRKDDYIQGGGGGS